VNIGYYSPGWPTERYPNGIVSYVDIIKSAMALQGHDCYVFAYNTQGERLATNIVDLGKTRQAFKPGRFNKIIKKIYHSIILGKPIWKDESLARSFLHHIEELEHTHNIHLDIIEIEESHGWAYDLVKLTDIPVVVKLHGPWFLNGTMSKKMMDRKYYRRVEAERRGICAAAGVIAPSQSVLDEVEKYYGIQLPNARVIHNPVSDVPEHKQWKLSQCNINQVLFVGRFDEPKGGDVVIKAFNRVAKLNKQVQLVFAGPDRGVRLGDDVVSLKDYIDTTIEDTAIKERIRYLGVVTRDKVNELRHESHVTIIASRWENFPYTVTEALVAGCPTIATNCGGIPEIIKDNETGLLFGSGDEIELANKISLLLSDDELAIRLSGNARKDITFRLDQVKIAKQNIEYYSRVVEHQLESSKPLL